MMLVTKTSVHLLLLRSPLSDFTTHYGSTSRKVCPGKFEWSRVIFHGPCSLSLSAVDEKMLRKLFFSHLSQGSYSTHASGCFQTFPMGKLHFCIFNCVSALYFFFFFFCSSNPSGLFLLLQVLLPTLCQHTRSRRSCSSLWARSQCLGSTQRCPLQAQGKCLSDGCDFQQLLQCNRSGRPLNKTAAGEMWMCYFVCLWKFFIWLVSSWLRPQPRGNQDDSGYAAQVFGAGRHSGL